MSEHHREKRISSILFILFFIIISVIIAYFCTEHARDEAEVGSGVDISSNSSFDEDWNMVLVNKSHHIPSGYKVKLKKLPGGERVDERIYPWLKKMMDAAREDGIHTVVADGYRTSEEQQKLMDKKIGEYRAQGYPFAKAKEESERWVASPGTSEHQLGIAVDINADGINSVGTDVYTWLYQNSYKYGFILRYPPDKTNITGTVYEPWHYRYVGIKVATEIHSRGICLEEYLGGMK